MPVAAKCCRRICALGGPPGAPAAALGALPALPRGAGRKWSTMTGGPAHRLAAALPVDIPGPDRGRAQSLTTRRGSCDACRPGPAKPWFLRALAQSWPGPVVVWSSVGVLSSPARRLLAAGYHGHQTHHRRGRSPPAGLRDCHVRPWPVAPRRSRELGIFSRALGAGAPCPAPGDRGRGPSRCQQQLGGGPPSPGGAGRPDGGRGDDRHSGAP